MTEIRNCHFCGKIIDQIDPHHGIGIGHERCELKAAKEARLQYMAPIFLNLLDDVLGSMSGDTHVHSS